MLAQSTLLRGGGSRSKLSKDEPSYTSKVAVQSTLIGTYLERPASSFPVLSHSFQRPCDNLAFISAMSRFTLRSLYLSDRQEVNSNEMNAIQLYQSLMAALLLDCFATDKHSILNRQTCPSCLPQEGPPASRGNHHPTSFPWRVHPVHQWTCTVSVLINLKIEGADMTKAMQAKELLLLHLFADTQMLLHLLDVEALATKQKQVHILAADTRAVATILRHLPDVPDLTISQKKTTSQA
jgi:hypothetical protein